ncbi:MAG: hypothetical protein H7641_15630 [Candidatus Heimdallarchaeota archaeon]|nr:hypothetical protein [Candidatus Heimdallarchaeota archaeon]MCK4878990.1 hypothetical protein [Candidatus Heimdallarchaeota archaeon]
MDTEVKSYVSSEIGKLLKVYTNSPNLKNAMNLGRAIATGSASLEVKKWRFRMALDVVTPDMGVYSALMAWSSITTLEDNVPPSQKIIAVKEMLRNPDLKPEVLDEVIKSIFVRKDVPRDLLNYIAPEIKKASRISDELKSYVLDKKDAE